MLPVLAGVMVSAAVLLAVLAGYVARRRGTSAGISLAVLLLAVAWWGLAYAFELSSADLPTKSRWGDLKYIGVGALGPAWLAFVLQYTGRAHLVTRRLLLALAVEPVLILAVLLNPATHDLVRFYRPDTAASALPLVGTGPLFWVHFAYTNILILGATAVFVWSVARISRLYWRLSAVLVAAALLPWTANLLHNFNVGPFTQVDLTPFAFIVTGGVLVWGLFRERLVKLVPVARGVVVETMADAVLVLDAYRRIVDANPAASRLLGADRAHLVGRRLADVLPHQPLLAPGTPLLAPGTPLVEASVVEAELTLPVDGQRRHFDARRQPLPDRGGAPAGEVVVLRDITDRKAAETQLRQLLAERTRVASALEASLWPPALPTVPGVRLAARYLPAGDGREIGGDFFDVFPIGPENWGIVLGDISGKGAEAAAVTALVRYTIRALVPDQSCPRQLLRALNEALLRQTADERYCTLAYAVAQQTQHGLRLSLCLGGHHPPLLRRRDRTVVPVGEPGTVLGLVEEPELHVSHVELLEGDLLCFFTDGLVEARNGRDLFGEERAIALLRQPGGDDPQLAAAVLETAAQRFRGGPLADDLALLLVRVDSRRRDAGAEA